MHRFIGGWAVWILGGLILANCGNKIERHIRKLEGGKEDREQAMMELVLVKKDAVGPLIKALDDVRKPSEVRVDVATVLFRIYMRERDPRILPGFFRNIEDHDPHLRSRIVIALGDIGEQESIAPLFERLEDPDEEVVYHALCALESLSDKMEEGEQDSLAYRAAVLSEIKSDTENGRRIRQKAEELLEVVAQEMVREAEKLALKADLIGAETELLRAKELVPNSLNVNLKLGKLYFDHGEEQKGLSILRRFNLAVHSRTLHPPPEIDGHLDDACWKTATLIDTLYQRLDQNYRATRATGRSEVFLGHTGKALYVALKAYKNRRDMVAEHRGRDSDVWRDDCLEIFIDKDRDYRSHVQICVNSLGDYFDMSQEKGTAYNGEFRAAAQVEEDFWSVEVEIPYEELGASKPGKGTVWGFNVISTRMGANAQQAQWVPTFGDPHHPSKYGFLIFE